MSEDLYNSDPNEEPTQTLNRMVAEIKEINARLGRLETAVDAQARNTNANLLAAFSEVLRIELEPIKESQARIEKRMDNLESEMKEMRRFTKVNLAELARTQAELEERVSKLETPRQQ